MRFNQNHKTSCLAETGELLAALRREINSTWPQDVGMGTEIIIKVIIAVTKRSVHNWLGFSPFFSQTDWSSSSSAAAGFWFSSASWLRYASLFSLAHLSSEIFIPPQHARIRGIMAQLHLQAVFKDKCAIFPLRSETKYIRRCLKTTPDSSGSRGTDGARCQSIGSPTGLQRCCAWGSPPRLSPSSSWAYRGLCNLLTRSATAH